MRRDTGFGCTWIILIGIAINLGLYYLSHRKSGKEYQERIDAIKEWKNLNYFKAFDCSPSLDETYNTKILKFFVFYTDKDANCDIEEIQKPTITFKTLNLKDIESISFENGLLP